MQNPKVLGPITFLILTIILSAAPCLSVAAQPAAQWRDEPVRVILQSSSDWGRILFDDLNGTNSNGLGVKAVQGSGWLTGHDIDDTIEAGKKIPWQDQVYGQIVVRHGDIVGFYKGLNDFNYTEMYADILLNVDVSQPQVYLWLMSGGNGTTTFEITSPTTGGTIWRDIVVGNSVTQQVRRIMSSQPFFHPGRTENLVVIAWLSAAIVAIIMMNFPVLELAHRGIRRVRRPHQARERNRT